MSKPTKPTFYQNLFVILPIIGMIFASALRAMFSLPLFALSLALLPISLDPTFLISEVFVGHSFLSKIPYPD